MSSSFTRTGWNSAISIVVVTLQAKAAVIREGIEKHGIHGPDVNVAIALEGCADEFDKFKLGDQSVLAKRASDEL